MYFFILIVCLNTMTSMINTNVFFDFTDFQVTVITRAAHLASNASSTKMSKKLALVQLLEVLQEEQLPFSTSTLPPAMGHLHSVCTVPSPVQNDVLFLTHCLTTTTTTNNNNGVRVVSFLLFFLFFCFLFFVFCLFCLFFFFFRPSD